MPSLDSAKGCSKIPNQEAAYTAQRFALRCCWLCKGFNEDKGDEAGKGGLIHGYNCRVA